MTKAPPDSCVPTPGLAEDMLDKATSTTALLKSLSHPARLILLCCLADGPATVGQLEQMMDLPQAEVSKQLARLRADNLVVAIRDGRTMTYSVREPSTVRIIKLLHAEFCS